MTDMQAAIGVQQLKKLPSFVEARRNNFSYLSERLTQFSDILRLPTATERSNPSWFGFLMSLKENKVTDITRDKLVADLETARVQTRMLFAGNIIRQPLFDEMRTSKMGFRQIGDLSNTDKLMNNAFWVGVYPGMTEAHLDHIATTIETSLER